MKKFNLIIFSPHSSWGGGEQSLYCFLKNARSYYSDQFDLRLVLAESGPLETRLQDLQIPWRIYPFPYIVGSIRPERFGQLFHLFYLRRIIREFMAPDTVFYFNGFYQCELMVVVVRFFFPRIPILIHIRNVFAAFPPHRRLALACSSAQLSISDFVRSSLPESYRNTPYSTYMHNMLDFETIDQIVTGAPLPFQHQPPYHLAIYSRISPEKGQEDFIEIARRVIQHSHHGDFIFHIYGSPLYGSTQFLTRIQAMIQHYGMEEQIRVEGFQPQVLEHIARMDGVLVLSDHEPLGRVVMESMALGRIVTAYAWGGPLELIQHGHNGFLMTPQNVDEAARLITELPTRKSEMTMVSRNAQASGHAMFDHPEYFRKFKTVIDSILP